jgi:hypothetical protein
VCCGETDGRTKAGPGSVTVAPQKATTGAVPQGRGLELSPRAWGEPNIPPFPIPRKFRKFRKFDPTSHDRGVPTRVKVIRTHKGRKHMEGGCSDTRGGEPAVWPPKLTTASSHTGGVNSREVREVRSWSPSVSRYAQATIASPIRLRSDQIWTTWCGQSSPSSFPLRPRSGRHPRSEAAPPEPKATPLQTSVTPSTRGRMDT